MYKTPEQTRAYVRAFLPEAKPVSERADVALLAPFVDLEALGKSLEGSAVTFGAQDCHWEREGACTGEISAAMLQAVGATFCIIGHSERRRMFGETDERVALKVSAVLAEGLTPIVCVGETLEEHRAGRTREAVERQVRAGLGHLSDAERASLVIAYEPVWAIGTGLADDPESANATIGSLRGLLGGLADIRILYGGSMKADNSGAFCAQPEIDGGLVGSASLDPAGFLSLIRNGLGRA